MVSSAGRMPTLTDPKSLGGKRFPSVIRDMFSLPSFDARFNLNDLEGYEIGIC